MAKHKEQGMRFSDRGIPILSLKEKIDALGYCMAEGSDEDAMGHLFDLMHRIAPGYRFLKFNGIAEIAAYYGEHPTPIED